MAFMHVTCVYIEVVVTGPTSLMTSLSLEKKRLSDTAQRHHDDDAHMTSQDDVEAGAMSDGELERRVISNHRILRNRCTVRSQVRLSHHLHTCCSSDKFYMRNRTNARKTEYLLYVSMIRLTIFLSNLLWISGVLNLNITSFVLGISSCKLVA